MKIGMMNNPGISLPKEIKKAAFYHFDFIDLALEPPRASSWGIEVTRIKELIQQTKIGVVGHTAYYLPVSHIYEKIQTATIEVLKSEISTFANLGVKKITIHYSFSNPARFFPNREVIRLWSRALTELIPFAQKSGVKIMLEHFIMNDDVFKILDEIFKLFPTLGFHLDVGHANLTNGLNYTKKLLDHYGNRLSHVHLSDNKGGDQDLHLPIYCGTVDWEDIVRNLKAVNYDSTITLEVFSPRIEYLTLSRQILLELWDKTR